VEHELSTEGSHAVLQSVSIEEVPAEDKMSKLLSYDQKISFSTASSSDLSDTSAEMVLQIVSKRAGDEKNLERTIEIALTRDINDTYAADDLTIKITRQDGGALKESLEFGDAKILLEQEFEIGI